MAVTSERHLAANSKELRDYLALFRRRRWILVVAVVLVTGTALTASILETPVYEARARLFLEPRSSVFDSAGQQLSPARVQTEIQVLQSAPVRAAVAETMGSAPPVAVTQVGVTEVLEVSVRGREPRKAAEFANAYVTAYQDFRRQQAVDDLVAKSREIQRVVDDLKAQVADLDSVAAASSEANRAGSTSTPERDALISQQALFKQKLDQLSVDSALTNGNSQVVAPADIPTTPISPRPIRSGVLGVGLGLILGIAVALVIEHLDDSIKTKEDLEHAAPGLAVVGIIPTVGAWRNRAETRVISRIEPNSPAAEAYRTLRTSINFMGLDRTMRVIQVTSANASEGKSTTIANLGVALARAGEQVVLLNCDLRRPRLHEFFGLSPAVGFTDVLVGDIPMPQAVQFIEGEKRLRILPSGKLPPNPSELLASSRTKQILDTLRNQNVMVLIDCPPVLPVTDAVVLSSLVDATLLVASAGSTTTKDLTRAIELLRQVGAPLIGTVLNGVSAESGNAYQYGYAATPTKASNGSRPPAASASRKRRDRASRAV
jgi:non-specific protein-tyrosine kinase